jgi:hypothetical protein
MIWYAAVEPMICSLVRFSRVMALIAMVILLPLFTLPSFSADTNTLPAASQSRTVDPLWTVDGARSVTGAFVVGTLGAAAFFLGVFFGFISRDSRERLLEYLSNKNTGTIDRWPLILFCIFGGVVAAVFQAAQAAIFAPIQAFVLGATWPSVVTRIMSGNGQQPSLTALASGPPSQIPAPKAGGSAADAEVVIKPKRT